MRKFFVQVILYNNFTFLMGYSPYQYPYLKVSANMEQLDGTHSMIYSLGPNARCGRFQDLRERKSTIGLHKHMSKLQLGGLRDK